MNNIVLLVLVLLCGVALAQDQEERQQRRKVVRVRGRPKQQQQDQPDVQGGLRDCPEQQGLQTFEDPDSCNRFFLCTNGTFSHETCENGLLFNLATSLAGSAHRHCSYNWVVNCGTRERDDTAVASADCPYRFGLFPTAGNKCSPEYTKCALGAAVPSRCELGLVFDEVTRGCNWPDQLLEQGCDPSSLLGGFKCPGKEQFGSLSALAQRFLPFPRFPVKGHKGRFVTCVEGLPRLQACGAGTSFDAETLSCIEDLE